MTGKNRENYNKNYVAYVNSFAPPTKHFKNCFRAFMVGGLICCIGQAFRVVFERALGLYGDELASAVVSEDWVDLCDGWQGEENAE